MAAPAHLLLSALSKPVADLSAGEPAPPTGRHAEAPLCCPAAEGGHADLPLTSEPPLPDAEPLTSEPPLAEAAHLTSECFSASAAPAGEETHASDPGSRGAES
ncbi:hypothetical protein ABZ920_03890 [Streptomyces sp. NPDC046831]|uniref:hypothetical protein n=1 Tax=Streptomyces sp. NPDC046831 TaxID=3154805 RepID=UPI00340A9AF8